MKTITLILGTATLTALSLSTVPALADTTPISDQSRYDVPATSDMQSISEVQDAVVKHIQSLTDGAESHESVLEDLNCYGRYCYDMVDGQWYEVDAFGVYDVDSPVNGY